MCVCVCVCVSVSVVHWALDSTNYMEGGSPLPYVKFSTLICVFFFFFALWALACLMWIIFAIGKGCMCKGRMHLLHSHANNLIFLFLCLYWVCRWWRLPMEGGCGALCLVVMGCGIPLMKGRWSWLWNSERDGPKYLRGKERNYDKDSCAKLS